ncbi:nitroreductase family protein [Desulfosarcina sp. OttesenSCG-928-A07]|nr:nitroreductase family protein [Desulfosarcina sp. OttesenSCG-928-G17]MDL2328938.1 nitroreductase family protein [Desulfosarcina sp. OttesenSCG-928-A07]
MALSVKPDSDEKTSLIGDHPYHPVTLSIDAIHCIGCGACLAVCPKDTLAIEDGHVKIIGNESLSCDHCAAACPAEVIRVMAVEPAGFHFETFQADSKWLPPGRFDTAALVNLMGSRRSCRHFSAAPVSMAVLTDLIKAGITAPSGTNCQPWTFTILPDRDVLDRFGQKVGAFFQKMNRMAEKKWLRKGLRLMGKPQLDNYFECHYATVKQGLDAFFTESKDLLFHGAMAGMVVAAQKDASTPVEDALLATQNILLTAHAMGLGACLIGFAVEAMRRDRSIGQFLNIPDSEIPCAVIALGWPEETYQRVAWRKPVVIRCVAKNPDESGKS